MKNRMYSVYDRKTLVYLPPYFALTDGAAIRTLSDAVADRNNMLAKHPNDYVLYFVGEFDDTNGQVLPAVPLVHVIDANTLVAALQQEIPFPAGSTNGRDVDGVRDQVVGGL